MDGWWGVVYIVSRTASSSPSDKAEKKASPPSPLLPSLTQPKPSARSPSPLLIFSVSLHPNPREICVSGSPLSPRVVLIILSSRARDPNYAVCLVLRVQNFRATASSLPCLTIPSSACLFRWILYTTSPIILAASLYVCISFSHFSRSFLTPSSS